MVQCTTTAPLLALAMVFGCGGRAEPHAPAAAAAPVAVAVPANTAVALASASTNVSPDPEPPPWPSVGRLASPLPPDVPPLPPGVATLELERSTPYDTVLSLVSQGWDLAPLFRTWLAGARAAGYAIVAEHPQDFSASLRGAAGERASLRLYAESEELATGYFQRAHHAPRPLDGPCVPVPEPLARYVVRSAGVSQSGAYRQSTMDWTVATFFAVDVDADGELDAMVPQLDLPPPCPWDALHAIYVMRGACGHAVGVVGPGALSWESRTAAPDSSGFRPLLLEASWSASGATPVVEHVSTDTLFRFTGKAYRQARQDRRAGRCEHCAASSCTRP